MAVGSKEVFSESSNGRLIQLVDQSSPGTLIHTTPTTNVKDVVYLDIRNEGTATNLLVSVEWGGTATLDIITQSLDAASATIPKGNMARVIPGFPLTTNVVFVGGFVNRFA